MMTENDDWRGAWDDMLAAVGRDFSDGKTSYGVDPVERSALRRYLEPLEFDCPLHFDEDDRNAQPARSPINDRGERPGPKTTGFFATDMELDFIRPVVVGECVGRRGNKLISCTPKETSVGRGAFLKWESELVNQDGEVVARMRTGTYAYIPRPASDGQEQR